VLLAYALDHSWPSENRASTPPGSAAHRVDRVEVASCRQHIVRPRVARRRGPGARSPRRACSRLAPLGAPQTRRGAQPRVDDASTACVASLPGLGSGLAPDQPPASASSLEPCRQLLSPRVRCRRGSHGRGPVPGSRTRTRAARPELEVARERAQQRLVAGAAPRGVRTRRQQIGHQAARGLATEPVQPRGICSSLDRTEAIELGKHRVGTPSSLRDAAIPRQPGGVRDRGSGGECASRRGSSAAASYTRRPGARDAQWPVALGSLSARQVVDDHGAGRGAWPGCPRGIVAMRIESGTVRAHFG